MNTSSIFFSVIIPTYNRAFCIERCLESVLNQDFEGYEIIIIDDGSTDNTEELLKPYLGEKVKYFPLPNNTGGPNKPKNIGSTISKGEWLIFHDSDDLLVPGALNIISNIIAENSSVDLLMTSCRDTNGKPTSTNPNYNGIISFENYFQKKVQGEYLPSVKRRVFEKFHFKENIISGESITWKSIAQSHEIFISSQVTRIYDNSSENRVSTKNKEFYIRVLKCHLVDIKVHWKNYLKFYPVGLVLSFVKIAFYSLKTLAK